MRRLVVTGDDFGFSREVNRAIAEGYDRGVLTSASLMVGGDAAQEAIASARSRPGLAVGLHLVVADGRPTLPASQIPGLVDGTGRFRAGLVRPGLRYQFSRNARRELEREIAAQLERFSETGLRLAHVDGHHHMHLHPTVLGILLGLADRYRIPVIRLPAEEFFAALWLDRRAVASKVFSSLVFRLLRRHARPRLAAAGIAYAASSPDAMTTLVLGLPLVAALANWSIADASVYGSLPLIAATL